MSEENTFGSIIKKARERMGWTQQEVADKFDTSISRVTVSRWEKNIQRPSDYHIKELVGILGLNEEEVDALNRAVGQPTFRIRILPLRNQLFTGREGQLEQISQHLKENSSIALCGLAGIGKTQLALEYAHCSYPDVYRAVFWVDAANSTMLLASYDKIARKLGLPEQDERDQELRIRAVKGWLEDHTNWLLIMDNADDLSLARSFFPLAHDGHILLTTRTQIVGKVARKIEVEKMEPEEGQLFLLRRSGMLEIDASIDDVAADIRKAAFEVVELLGGHPLALDQAGAYIEGGVSLTDYIDHYLEQRRCVLEDRGLLDDDHPESVVVTFKLCFEMACEQHPLATDILRFCAFLHPDAMPVELFKYDDSFKLDKLAFKKGIEALLRYSLMKHNAQEKTFSMHRLVQAVLIEDMSQGLQNQWRERVVKALNEAFPDSDFTEWARCERLISHVLAFVAWKEDELTSILGVAGLFDKVSYYLYERSQFSDAETLLARVLSIVKRHFGVEHPHTAIALSKLAISFFWQGRVEEAISLLQQAQTIMEKSSGADHLETVWNPDSLAINYSKQGKDEQAESLHQQVLTIREKHLGNEHPDTARILYRLAWPYVEQGKFEQAEPLLVQAHTIMEKSLGAEHLETAHALVGLAECYKRQGKFEQAEPLFHQAIAIEEKCLGAENPFIASSLCLLAVLLHYQGKYEQAEAVLQRVRSILPVDFGLRILPRFKPIN